MNIQNIFIIKKLIRESEQYVKDLQKKSDPNEPVRKKLLEENQKLKVDIQKYVNEGIKLKEELDKQIREGSLDIQNLEENSKKNIQSKIETFQEKTKGGIFLNASLKSELIQLQQRNHELERFKRIADEQYKKLELEIKAKVNETIMISTENIELQARINESQKNKEELYELINEKEKLLKKINLMKGLNDNYKSQYKELIGETAKKKKKRKNKNKKKNKKKQTDGNEDTNSTTYVNPNSINVEHDHNHIYYYIHHHNHDIPNKQQIEHYHCFCSHFHH